MKIVTLFGVMLRSTCCILVLLFSGRAFFVNRLKQIHWFYALALAKSCNQHLSWCAQPSLLMFNHSTFLCIHTILFICSWVIFSCELIRGLIHDQALSLPSTAEPYPSDLPAEEEALQQGDLVELRRNQQQDMVTGNSE